ncbi:A24 family peptidase C-terminal domain-containing protein [Thermococcus sp. SY098]|uniref:A24 family peptidase C-terminal domain-containing protein n=1 Tax=Thermococcus sp. SY098 TaxID=3111325 RepID=UPI002D76570E|nr:A24 family peptidase C-terminal domain-containing protein [Thermococcus sp. SY098]WRS53333.1 A24 family peptidase C-terminal domain-containing protein [Thermococcus sp. SY098]
MQFLLIALGVIMGVLTSYTDIKTGFIDDKHIFPFVALGIVYYICSGLKVGNLFYASSGLIGLGAGFLIGYLMYLMGGWASGDVIILAGYSALFPYASEYAKIKAPYAVYYPLHALTLFFNSIIGVFPFLFIYALASLIVKKKTDRLKAVFTENVVLTVELTLWIMVSLGFFVVLQYYLGVALHPLVRWIGTLVLVGILGKYKKVGNTIGVASLAIFTYITGSVFLRSFVKLLVIFYIFKVFFSLTKVLREEILIERKPIEELKEWDILGEWIYEKNGEILRDRESFTDKFKKALVAGNLSLLKLSYENVIASPTAEGLTKEQIEKLKKLVDEGKLENEFIVRKAMPFAPALFLGFLISVFYGDLFWLLLQKMSGL